uniref:RING-type E3 ubiquitin transferase n=1 Tax=Arcella intermedia TaxID=1963864 RepID=A0A6B2LDS1_9EUKA
MNKVSLHLVPRDAEGDFDVRFAFDCTCPVVIRLLFFKPESGLKDVAQYKFDAGLGQLFSSDEDSILNLTSRPESDLTYDPNTNQYPIIINLQALPDTIPLDDTATSILSQTTYAIILKCSDGSYEMKAIEQQIMSGETSYVVQDIYGIDQNSKAPPDECVICMTEYRDTVALPCRHMCVCHQCAQVLRYQSNKCPICRGPVRSMIKIKIEKHSNSKSDSSEKQSDEDIIIPLKTKSKVMDDIVIPLETSQLSDSESLEQN